jgi:hypothetical protein
MSAASHAGGSGPLYPKTPEAMAAAEEPVAIPGRQDDETEPADEASADGSA